MSPATAGWLCLAVALLPLGAIVGMCVAERYRADLDVWRRPWTWVASGRCDTVPEPDETTEFAEELPAPIQRLSRWRSQQPVLLDLPEHVDGYPIGGRHEARHGNGETAEESGYRPRHSLFADITAEFAAIVAETWSVEERLALEWWCPSCRGELEHGRPHEVCDPTTCACPCTLLEVSR